MTGSVLICAMLAVGAAPEPRLPANLAPPPRMVKPDVSLVVIEARSGDRARVVRVGFRKGKMLPPEMLCEANFLEAHRPHQLVAHRFLVTDSGGVIDLHAGRVVSGEREGWVIHVGETKVTYTIDSKNRDGGVFACEYATGKVTRIEKVPARPWYSNLGLLIKTSPDNTKAVEWRDEDELILHREFGKPVSLGKGFKRPRDPKAKVDPGFLDWTMFPVLWLGDERFLTQRDHGKLVTVDLAGKVSEVVTIKDVPEFGRPWPFLSRDSSGAIIYSIGQRHFVIDVAKKTAVKSEWEALGHGFEASWEAHDKRGHLLRYAGKDIGQQRCYSFTAVTMPGYLAMAVHEGEEGLFDTRRVAVWWAELGRWETVEFDSLGVSSVVGWIK